MCSSRSYRPSLVRPKIPMLVGFLAFVASQHLGAELPTREEALAQLFPGAALARETVFLTDEERRDVEKLSGVKMETSLVGLYRVRRDGHEVARAYVDTHVVRTKKESLLVVVDDKGQVRRVETTAFLEPLEYQAPQVWLNQYQGRDLGSDLAVNRSIRPLAGATLTARAANQAVRRTLALDQVLRKKSARARAE